ncbi:MAG: SGNH/GDSL hydrolase family protein [Acidimicrobiales bacterium]|nr:SGNH/GDSL hydrolase family protein [Acidimicrobiales bacterium]
MRQHRRMRRLTLVGIALLVLTALTSCALVIDRASGRQVTKVLLVGDSVMWGAATDIAEEFSAFGVEVRYVGLAATGPLWNNKRWASWTAEAVTQFKPDLVILEACCVYPGIATAQYGGGQLFVNSAGTTVEPDSDLMFAEWKKAMQELIAIARFGGASVWVVNMLRGLEPARYYGALFPERINRLRELYKTLGAPIVDWDAAVYSQTSPDAYRAPDGVHPNTAGYDFLAKYTFNATVFVQNSAPGTGNQGAHVITTRRSTS